MEESLSCEDDEENSSEEADDVEGFDCTFCGESFESSDELSKHVLGNHRAEVEESLTTDDFFECWMCEKVFKSQAILDVHLKSHVNNAAMKKTAAKKHGCDICSKFFETPSKLLRHMSVHRDVLEPEDLPPQKPKQFHYACSVCEKPIETPSKLERHMRVHDDKNKLYTGINQHRPHACLHCDQRFWDAVKLERHSILHSEDLNMSKINHPLGHMFTCVICLTQIPDFEDCINHMKSHREEYGESSPVSCKLCSKVYPRISSLIRHARVHVENATHECIHCGKKMGLGDDLIEHMLRHQGFKPYVCKICNKSFLKSHKLKQHLVTHEDRETYPFQCNICDKVFNAAEYLKRHLLRHSGQKNHTCTICPARFTFKNGLTAHMATHQEKKKFSCEICSADFTKKQSLKVHMMTHTGEVSFCCNHATLYQSSFKFHRKSSTAISAAWLSLVQVT